MEVGLSDFYDLRHESSMEHEIEAACRILIAKWDNAPAEAET
jgi:hypothetical protein